jgi:thymidylate synthase
MNNIEHDYLRLLKDILDNGVKKDDRTGTGTVSVFGRQIRHKMSEGFPLLTTKKMAFKTMVTELLWFLQGDTNIKYLVDNNCNIWNGDAYKGYEKECTVYGVDPMSMEQFIQAIKLYKDDRDWIEKIKSPATHFIPDLTGYQLGDLGPVYGKQWRKWQGWMHYKNDDGSKGYGSLWYDQILRLIADLERNPDSRRLMVNAWNVAEIDQMVLPPCHYGFQVYTRELSLNDRVLEFAKRDLDPSEFRRGGNYGTVIPEERTLEVLNNHNIPTRAISLMWNQRSVDTFLGLPFNIASYGLLLMMLAKRVNMVPDELIGNLGDVHLYSNHIDQAKEQLNREPMKLPSIELDFEYTYYDGYITEFNKIDRNSIKLINYESHPEIKAPLSN